MMKPDHAGDHGAFDVAQSPQWCGEDYVAAYGRMLDGINVQSNVLQKRSRLKQFAIAGRKLMQAEPVRFVEESHCDFGDMVCVHHIRAVTRAQRLNRLHGERIIHN